MLRSFRKISFSRNFWSIYIQKKSFLTNDYKCTEAWNEQISSPVLAKVNLSDFYNVLEQNYTSKGVISAIDVDIFANALNDSAYLEELKDLLRKLRLSAETGRTLESTHYATVRHYIQFDHIEELINILKDPLNYGIFLDNYTSNILLDKLISLGDHELAANVASLIMLQEDYTNEITCALCQYACYKYITTYKPPPEEVKTEVKGKKVEEVKIRIKFLRNPYFDDHFDIKDTYTASGKTLAWMSEGTDYANSNLQIIGWLIYKKYDKLALECERISQEAGIKVFKEVIELLKNQSNNTEDSESKVILENCIIKLSKKTPAQISLEESLTNKIESAINKVQNVDIGKQQELFKSWVKTRNEKLEEQIRRLDRAKRIQLIQEKQKEMEKEEQKLWFFENEEAIDLEIEKKQKLIEKASKFKATKKTDENYIPPEILPKKR